jgi:hypothetical protein
MRGRAETLGVAVTPNSLMEVSDVTEPTTRLLQTFSLPAFDFDATERRLLRGAGVGAAVVLWFSAALINAWFLVALPLLAAACAGVIWRLRRARPEREPEDWSF